MTNTIKVQDGNLTVSSVDQDVNVNVLGQLYIGNNTNNDVITTSNNSNLIIGTDGGAHMVITTLSETNGILEINNVQWPDNFLELDQDSVMFVEHDQNDLQYKLKYRKIVLGQVNSDALGSIDLNQLYPVSHNGNIVVGPNTLYLCLGNGVWVGQSASGSSGSGTSGGAAPTNPIIGTVNTNNATPQDLELQFSNPETGSIVVGPEVVYIKVSFNDWRRLGYVEGDPLVLSEIPYDLMFSYIQSLTSNQTIGSYILPRAVRLEVDLPGSLAVLDSSINDDIYIDIIHKSATGSQTIGNLQFVAESTVGKFTLNTSVSLQVGDIIKLKSSSTQATISSPIDLSATIVGWVI